MKEVKVVIGGNFGDEGKGLMTDYFAAKAVQNGNSCLVVLHNGGAQRGHTVVTPEGYRHVFHHFGSGSCAGADTYCAEEFVVNPALFREEYEKLAKHGNVHKFFINPKCKLTTIYDMLINQVIEFDRGANKHGSCGIGVYETLYRNQKGIDFVCSFKKYADTMTVGDFAAMNFLNKMEFLEYLRGEYVPRRFAELGLANDVPGMFQFVLRNNTAMVNFIDDFQFMLDHSEWADETLFDRYHTVVFENGQGILLDQHNMDYFPHLTPSNTGVANPTAILNAYGWTGEVEVCYVTRTYMTRHGVGRFDTECPKKDINANMIDMTNVPNPFQDALRYGHMNWGDFYRNITKDCSQAIGRFTVNMTVALTHVNEYAGDVFVKPNYISTGLTCVEVEEV